ncbi:MAG: hypothetical protein HY758_01220, partial [Nitrospirae bacterium]|nr:hypothetical protein [Nitrospirota bacterium]
MFFIRRSCRNRGCSFLARGKKPSAFREFIVGKTESLKKIERPYDIGAVKGKIYISDRTLKKIIIVDLINKEFDLIKDSKEGALSEPAGIWVTEDDFKYVADMERKQIVVYDYDNKFLRAYGEKDQFSKPFDVAVYGNRIYVCDFARHQIAVVNKDSGKTIETIGRPGSNDGEFANPTHVIVDKEGNVYVNDSFNFRVQKFNPQGEFIKKFGYHGDTAGGFARPKGIAFDDEGHLYVVDTASEYTQIFDDNTTDVLLPFGGFGANGEG